MQMQRWSFSFLWMSFCFGELTCFKLQAESSESMEDKIDAAADDITQNLCVKGLKTEFKEQKPWGH